jgi:hypothetical protein
MKPGDNPLGEAVVLVCDRHSEPREVRFETEGYPGDAGMCHAREVARQRYRVSFTLYRWARGVSPLGKDCWVAKVEKHWTARGSR